MVIYVCKWQHNEKLAKGKGKVTMHESSFVITCLCRNSADAVKCLQWYFTNEFYRRNKHSLTIDDGEILLHRSVVDSRNFTANYLLMDGMNEPLFLSDIKSNITRLTKIF